MYSDKQSKLSMPLVSRLDHLDSIMKHLEGKQSLSKWSCDDAISNGINTSFMPLDLAVREACSKGSLLDRINTLENRLIQLCKEMEPSRRLSTSLMVQKSRDITSSHKCSSPIFSTSNHGCKQVPKVPRYKFDLQSNNLHKEQERLKQLRTHEEQVGKNRPNKDGKTGKTGKKRVSPNWSHLKILGC